MTITQFVIIVAGLLAGYKLVSLMLSPGNGDAEPRKEGWRKGSNESIDAEGSIPASSPPWYETLGVAESASPEEIEHAYRLRMSQYHPDKVARLGDDIRHLAEARSKEINAAYDTAMKFQRH